MKKTKLALAASAALLLIQLSARAGLIQDLDASDAASVQTNASGTVTNWLDKSGAGNAAVSSVGTVTYPSTNLLNGLAAAKFGPARSSLQLFSSAASAAWLNQSGSTNGFCVLVAFRCNALITSNWTDIIGNSSAVSSGFFLRYGYGSSGSMVAYLGGVGDTKSGAAVSPGDRVVYGFNYSATNGQYEFWDSKNQKSDFKTVAASNFSLPAAVTLGSTANSGRYLNGEVGEVQVYDRALSAADFKQAHDTLTDKWTTHRTGLPLVSDLFQNNMVLQRDMNAPVLGWSVTGAVVTLKLDGATVGSATAGPDGKWLARIGSHPHDGGVPHTLEISSPNEDTLTLTNVVFGDVYIASGQSNMARVLNDNNVIGGAAEIAAANYPLVRQISINTVVNPVPLTNALIAKGWTPCSPATANGFSATGYFFAKNVYLQTGVPVGLLFCAWGAMEIQRFLAPEGVAAIPELSGLFQFVAGGGSTSSNPYYDIYNGMIAPLVPYGVRGAIWYQGEWDAGDDDVYHQKMRALMAGWRKNWGQGNFPFYYVQLPNYGSGFSYSRTREGQLHSLTETNCGMAVTIDVGDGNLHPLDKQDVGYRLAQWAVAKDDGQAIPYSGPLIKGVTNEGGRLRISFDYVNSGLMVGIKDSTNPVVPVPGGPLGNFELADSNKVFSAATAVIDGRTVVVSNAAIANPVYVRYCYADWPASSNKLYNLDGFPASPFRTDEDYELIVESGGGDNSAVVPGAVMAVTADAAPSGMVFDRWVGIASGIDHINASAANVTMPQHSLVLLATYRSNSVPAYTLTVNQGSGSGTSQAGSSLNLEAQPAAAGWYFDHWAGDTQMVANVMAPSTTLQMPASNVTVTAVYNPLPAAAQFTGAPVSGARPLAVMFTDQSTGNINNLLWDFGDGQTTNAAVGAVLLHNYTNAGSYTVSMVASGPGGVSTNTKSGYVAVNVPPSPNIGSISVSGTTNLLLTGSGGPTNGTYYYWVRSSTDMMLPLTNWSVVATNLFNPDGSFSNALPVIPGIPAMFYRLQLP